MGLIFTRLEKKDFPLGNPESTLVVQSVALSLYSLTYTG
jgi:hypothetical protein